MAPLTEAEEKVLAQHLLGQLSQTPYACAAVIKLSGGTANFVYRGNLIQPLRKDTDLAATNTVVIKHSTGFTAINREFTLDITRCFIENSMLDALAGFSQAIGTLTGNIQVKAPRVYFFDRETYTQVLEDFSDTIDLTTVLESPNLDQTLPGSSPASVGRALGSWLRLFHTWASAPAQNSLLAQIGPHQAMRQLKCLITYDSFIEILQRYPETMEGYKDTLEKVRATMKYEFERPATEGDEVRGLIHGDFWAGK
jgi:hypothetical protein